MTKDATAIAPRKLGVLATSALVVGNMVGSGVYLLPASLAAYGGVSLFGWLFTSAGALCLALIFSRLAAAQPSDGGPYAYVRLAFGDLAGFLVAWGCWIATWCGNAAIAVAFAGYSGALVPALSRSPATLTAVAIAAIWLLTWVNSKGVHKAGAVQVVTTLLKLAPLLAIGTAGLFALKRDHFQPFNLSGETLPDAVSATAALTLWAFLGLESATIPASHVERPHRTIPRATLLGTALVALVYIASTTAVLGLVSPNVLASQEAPFAAAAGVLWGGPGAVLVAAGAAISAFGALNGWILIQGQMPKAAAQDGLLPSVFKRLNRHGAPAAGLVISSALTTLLTAMNFTRGIVGQFTFFALLATLITLLPYVLTSAALVVLRLRHADRFSVGSRGGNIALGLLGFLYSIWAMAGTGREAVFWGFLLLLSGVPVFVWRVVRRP